MTNRIIIALLCFSVSLSAAAQKRFRLWHRHHAATTVAPYVPQPDGVQRQLNADVPAAAETAVQPAGGGAPGGGETRSVATSYAAGTVVSAPSGSTLAIDGVSGPQLYNVAMQYLGRPYRSGASGPAAFDCSGFTSYVYKALNIRLSRSSREQYLQGVPVQRGNLRVGDLVFFARGGSRGRINHVGMVCEVMPDGNFKFVHACSRGVSIDNFGTAAYYRSRYVGARRIVE